MSSLHSPGTLAAPTDAFRTVDGNDRVEQITRAYFSDIPVMAEIAWCESKFKHFEKDGGVNRGDLTPDDLGVMQVNEYFHGKTAETLGYNLKSIGGNLMYARYLYEKEGTTPWNSSKHCWSKRTQHIAQM